ncbi:hypothetical protein Poli38472_006378 [Pythium oligandrum]|uniref:Uncharacterized protein n=1 Tax=Pythium oligandrum TaxID=41045 RepID=A0A8K1FF19_PYTOL|nr:hypothetical protein Poli38472_006378 [Pythium oligandrum]|eukprot:TMW56368.1 hypothetical protein Poli38472_006378 [Pythium oligandrum]
MYGTNVTTDALGTPHAAYYAPDAALDGEATVPITDTAFFLAIDHRQRRENARDVSQSDGSTFGRLHESFRNAVLDLYAASQILCIHLVTFESLFCVIVAVVATTAYYLYGTRSKNGSSFGANISWMIVSFAIVSPLIMQIKQSFSRRELALQFIGEARALFVNIFMANAIWNWGDNGRAKLPPDYTAKTKELLHRLVNDTATLLLLPTVTRGRHRFTATGRQIALGFAEHTQRLQLQVVDTFRQLHQQVEVMKSAGLPANEASRINQYHWLLQARLEKLQNIKFYRTPQATRSFTRLFILTIPIFYGPYYVYLLHSDDSHQLSFAFCLMLSVLTSLTMIGLFNVEIAMEDPFVGGGLDGIRIKEMLVHLRLMLNHCDEQLHSPSAKDIR